MRLPCLLAEVLLLGGCTANYVDPELPPTHPASPSADEAPPLPRSRTLDPIAAEPGNAVPTSTAGGQ